ncbi:hypothetical protein HALA3H3_510007 [Halomonas sp. A3H3]|jgi:hypothetical protein|nr:hypothetical protein HALA3H3_510007 [Halomonas sp. A3H3]|tara:strand:+ start:1441 stop:1587 length:147 start_codon:yes stop_codon:yes gene_type:complete
MLIACFLKAMVSKNDGFEKQWFLKAMISKRLFEKLHWPWELGSAITQC